MAKTDNVAAIVAGGRTVDLDGKKYGPGDRIVVSALDAASLRASGFLADEPSAPAKAGKAGDSPKPVKTGGAGDTGDTGGAAPGGQATETPGDTDPAGDAG